MVMFRSATEYKQIADAINKIDLETVIKEAEYYTYTSDTIIEIKQTLGLSEDKFVNSAKK